MYSSNTTRTRSFVSCVYCKGVYVSGGGLTHHLKCCPIRADTQKVNNILNVTNNYIVCNTMNNYNLILVQETNNWKTQVTEFYDFVCQHPNSLIKELNIKFPSIIAAIKDGIYTVPNNVSPEQEKTLIDEYEKTTALLVKSLPITLPGFD